MAELVLSSRCGERGQRRIHLGSRHRGAASSHTTQRVAGAGCQGLSAGVHDASVLDKKALNKGRGPHSVRGISWEKVPSLPWICPLDVSWERFPPLWWQGGWCGELKWLPNREHLGHRWTCQAGSNVLSFGCDVSKAQAKHNAEHSPPLPAGRLPELLGATLAPQDFPL